MPPTITFPDVLGDVRTWLRTLPALSGLTGGRVFFSIPASTGYPLIRLYETGGGTQAGEAPVQDVRIAVEVMSVAGSDYAKVSQTILAVRAALHTLTGPIGAGTFVLNAQAGAAVDAPDPDTGGPRKVLDVVLTVRSA